MNERNQFVDIMCGIAMLLVVLGHTMTGCTTGRKRAFCLISYGLVFGNFAITVLLCALVINLIIPNKVLKTILGLK